MTHRTNHSGSIASICLVGIVVLSAAVAGCSSNKQPEPATPAAKPTASAQPKAAAQPTASAQPKAAAAQPAAAGNAAAASAVTRTRAVDAEPGVAGGIIEDTSTISVKVVEVDRVTRKVTLADDAGKKASFVAGDEIRNLDQLQVGDKVTATLKDRLTIYVRPAGAGDEAGATYAAAVAKAPKGTKPGGIVAESYEVIASVSAIDATERTATLQFADGSTRPVQVRPDVDLARYKVGDTVIIRVTSALSVLAAQP
jgi:hypothetical protein